MGGDVRRLVQEFQFDLHPLNGEPRISRSHLGNLSTGIRRIADQQSHSRVRTHIGA
jgi:hypothetical protein